MSRPIVAHEEVLRSVAFFALIARDPTVELIAEDLVVSSSTVRRRLLDLEARAWIVRYDDGSASATFAPTERGWEAIKENEGW